jgi:crossover junction endodeoxyribonuclease RuvC
VIAAFDPGLSGAVAFIGDTVEVMDLPVHQAQHGRGAKVRTELDLHGLRDCLSARAVGHCFIERVTARPGQGTVSMFRFGESAGQIYGILVGLGLAVTFCEPRQWQRHHGIGASADAARQRCLQLYPHLSGQLRRVKDCHRADAVLIGAYGLYMLAQSQPQAERALQPPHRDQTRCHGWYHTPI